MNKFEKSRKIEELKRALKSYTKQYEELGGSFFKTKIDSIKEEIEELEK